MFGQKFFREFTGIKKFSKFDAYSSNNELTVCLNYVIIKIIQKTATNYVTIKKKSAFSEQKITK